MGFAFCQGSEKNPYNTNNSNSLVCSGTYWRNNYIILNTERCYRGKTEALYSSWNEKFGKEALSRATYDEAAYFTVTLIPKTNEPVLFRFVKYSQKKKHK